MPPQVNSDRNNYSFFGHARIDQFNDTEMLSSQVGFDAHKFTTDDDRHNHQNSLLEARLNTFIDAMNTPFGMRKIQIGPFDMPYTNATLS